MRSIRLPETDIANIAFQPYDQKIRFLSGWLKPKNISGSYEPLRRSIGEAVNLTLPLIPDPGSTSLEQLEALVVKECKGNGKLVGMNVPPVKAIRKFIDDNEVEADFLEELPMALYPGIRYSFWAPILVRYAGKPRVIFMDLRRSGGLSVTGLQVCFSIMHERFRALNPDFSMLKFESWRFANNSARTVKVIEEFGELLSLKQIIDDFAETYSILNMLRSGSDDRSTGTDDAGPLFR